MCETRSKSFKDCLCHECRDLGLCDGQAADDCDIMNLAEFETTLNDRMAKLDDQFETINEMLKTKKRSINGNLSQGSTNIA